MDIRIARNANIKRPQIKNRPLKAKPTNNKVVVDKKRKMPKISISTKQIKPKSLKAYNNNKAVRQKTPPVHKLIRKQAPITRALNREYKKQKIEPKRLPISDRRNFDKYNQRILDIKGIGKGRVLIMIACGPSVLEAPLELLIDHPKIDFMAINKPYGFNTGPKKHRGIWPTKFWVFCDHSQYNRNQDAWNSYGGTIINSPAVRAKRNNQIIIRNIPGKGFSKDLSRGYHIGRSTTYANMQTAYWLGYDKVYIFGLDMCEIDGKLHHYGVNPDVSSQNRKSRFANEAEYYAMAANLLPKPEKEKFVICSSYNPWGFVKQFGYLHQKEAPPKILDRLQ